MPLVPGFEVGQSRPCPQGASSLRQTEKHRTGDAATTDGCGALSLGWGREAGSCALGTESRGAGTMLHKSTRHSVRSWGKFGAKAPERPGNRLIAQGTA